MGGVFEHPEAGGKLLREHREPLEAGGGPEAVLGDPHVVVRGGLLAPVHETCRAREIRPGLGLEPPDGVGTGGGAGEDGGGGEGEEREGGLHGRENGRKRGLALCSYLLLLL